MPTILKKPHRKLKSHSGKKMPNHRAGHRYYNAAKKQGSRKRIRHG